MKKTVGFLLALAVGAAVTAGCGTANQAAPASSSGSSGSAPSASAPSSNAGTASQAPASAAASSPASGSGTASQAPSAGDVQEIKLVMNDFSYSMPEIKVKAGQHVRFVLQNQGKVEHDINNEELQLDKDVEPGKTEEYDWTVPDKKGTYEIVCDKPGHKEKGMKLTMVIE